MIVDVNVKNRIIRALLKEVACGILAHVIASVIKRVKLVNI